MTHQSTSRSHDQVDALRPAETASGIVQERYGTAPESILTIKHACTPDIAKGEVLVRVRAASVDRGTWHLMAGLPYPLRLAGFGILRPKHANPGRALAGTVESVGTDVHDLKPGDAVYGIGHATFAAFACAPAAKLAPKPTTLTFAEAATVPISGLTAIQAIRDHAQVRAGDSVLILGASGGVGSFAVQIAKSVGARVTGVCSAAKIDQVRALGSDHVLDYLRQDPTDGRQRYDVILDAGGNPRLAHLRRALTPNGRLVIVGGENGGRWLGGTDRQVRARMLNIVISQQLTTFINNENRADLVTLRDMIDSGGIAPAVDRTYPLGDVPAAIRYLLDGQARGKISIAIHDAHRR